LGGGIIRAQTGGGCRQGRCGVGAFKSVWVLRLERGRFRAGATARGVREALRHGRTNAQKSKSAGRRGHDAGGGRDAGRAGRGRGRGGDRVAGRRLRDGAVG